MAGSCTYMLRSAILLAIHVPVMALTQTCPQYNKINPVPLMTNARLDGHQVSHLMGFELERCVLECFLLKLCVSFNFRERLGVCELNGATLAGAESTQMKEEPDFEYHDLQAWSGQSSMAGTCASKPCAENQRCISTTPSHTCADVDCGPPPRYRLRRDSDVVHLTSTQELTSLGSRAFYSSNDEWYFVNVYVNDEYPFYENKLKVCNSDYRWSDNPITCRSRLINCEAVRVCNAEYTDGHYWIHFAGYANNKVKVYCHGMTSNLPETYISLPHDDNVANDAGSGSVDSTTTTFQKIKMLASFTPTVVRDAYLYSMTTGPGGQQPFGEAASCHGDGTKTPKIYGYFNINLTGTGLKLDSFETTNWTSTPEGASEMLNLAVTEKTASGSCWGNCGTCAPSTDLALTFDPNDDVDGTGVISPTCV